MGEGWGEGGKPALLAAAAVSRSTNTATKVHHEFPHETTADRWFDEAQFESCRKLGLHSLDALTCGCQKQTVEDLFRKAARVHRSILRKLPESSAAAKGKGEGD